MSHYILVLCLVLSATSIAAPAFGATTTPKNLAGSGPIDRPTAHTNGWTFQAWSQSLCPDAPAPGFIADGDSAIVRWTVRNWRTGASTPRFRLENVVVVERSLYEAQLRELGDDLTLLYSSVVDPSTQAFDFAPLLPDQVVYHTDFGSQIGAEWDYDPSQVSWESAYLNPDVFITGVMFDDPFQPEYDNNGEFFSSSGEMRIGAGSGPEFVTVELQLSGLTAGSEYVVSYWSRSLYTGTTDICIAPNQDWEVDVFGEGFDCTPDLPNFDVGRVRTLAWDPGTSVWRFQVELENAFRHNVTVGPSTNADLSLTIVPSGVSIMIADATIEDLDPGETVWSGPLQVDLQGRDPNLDVRMTFVASFADDCGERATRRFSATASGPQNAPTSAPARRDDLLLDVHPNPFNPRTNVRLQMPAPGMLQVEIHDLRGRRLRELFSGRTAGGPIDLVWDGRDDRGSSVSSGIYFVVARWGQEEARQKIALVR